MYNMKRLSISALALVLSLSLITPVIAANKVTICHVPAGNPENAHSITIAEAAIKAHIGLHGGDYLGECVVPEPPVVVEPPVVEPPVVTPPVVTPEEETGTPPVVAAPLVPVVALPNTSMLGQ
jgi:hypothetical protein